jgi:ribonuclease P protein component
VFSVKHKHLTFLKKNRLLATEEFNRVYTGSPKTVSHQYYVLLIKENELENARLGISLSKKKVKRAVARNKIKRTIRESFRLNQFSLKGIDIIILPRMGIDKVDRRVLKKSLDEKWKTLQ